LDELRADRLNKKKGCNQMFRRLKERHGFESQKE
jgi:hypothetical protein